MYNIDLTEIRPGVLKAASVMERVLRANDYKGGWKSCTNHYLINRLFDEVAEVNAEYMNTPYSQNDFKVSNELALEIIDVMNMGMMILDNMTEPIEVKYNKISMEMNPDKQLINELKIKLSDCEIWLKEQDGKLCKIRTLVESCEESHISVLEHRIIEILDSK